jgi:hypothetical protein
MKNITSASNEKLIFNKKIENIFLEFIIEEAYITDESTLLDFISMFDISYSKGQNKEGLYIFEIKSKRNLKDTKYETSLFECEGTNEQEELINKINNIFNIDVSDSLSLPLPLLFQKIQKETSQEIKIKLGLI